MPDEAAEEIRQILNDLLKVHHEGILSSVDELGRPHSAWMGVLCSHDYQYLITVTSPDSDKVANVRKNPHVEWMLASADRLKIMYFEGVAETVMDEQLKEQYIQMVPPESRQFFMKYYHNTGEYVVIRTRIDHVVYCMPGAYTKVRLSMDQIRK